MPDAAAPRVNQHKVSTCLGAHNKTAEPANGRRFWNGDSVVAVYPTLPTSMRFRSVLIPEHYVVLPDHAAHTVRVLPTPDVEQRPLSVYELVASGGRSS